MTMINIIVFTIQIILSIVIHFSVKNLHLFMLVLMCPYIVNGVTFNPSILVVKVFYGK